MNVEINPLLHPLADGQLQPKAVVGRQQEMIGDTILWVLPNPSGLNANYQQKDLARLFKELRAAVETF